MAVVTAWLYSALPDLFCLALQVTSEETVAFGYLGRSLSFAVCFIWIFFN